MATGKKKKSVVIALHCKVCNSQNYHIKRNIKAEKLTDLARYCANCQAHTQHVEKKIPKAN